MIGNKKRLAWISFLILGQAAIYALPFTSGCQTIGLHVSLDSFTTAQLISDSQWYSTRMPAFDLEYSLNILKPGYLCRWSNSISYFESNRFTLNSVQLDEGMMRRMLISARTGFLLYYSLGKYLSCITGGELFLLYTSSGQVIAPQQTLINEAYILGIRPGYGLALHLEDFWEINVLMRLDGGIPLSGELSYPATEPVESLLYPLGINLEANGSSFFSLFYFGFGYNYRLEFQAGFDELETLLNPDFIEMNRIHSLSIHCGVWLP